MKIKFIAPARDFVAGSFPQDVILTCLVGNVFRSFPVSPTDDADRKKAPLNQHFPLFYELCFAQNQKFVRYNLFKT
jgi:hypothetical protein